MNGSRWTKALLLTPVMALLVLGVAMQRPATAAAQQCPRECSIKIERGPWSYSGDKVIVSVCLKAGTNTFSFFADGGNGCYDVKGIGTNRVTVAKIAAGKGSTCKDVSHVVFYYDCKK